MTVLTFVCLNENFPFESNLTIKIWTAGVPRWSRSYESALALQGAWFGSQVQGTKILHGAGCSPKYIWTTVRAKPHYTEMSWFIGNIYIFGPHPQFLPMVSKSLWISWTMEWYLVSHPQFLKTAPGKVTLGSHTNWGLVVRRTNFQSHLVLEVESITTGQWFSQS